LSTPIVPVSSYYACVYMWEENGLTNNQGSTYVILVSLQ
jgi:hypothetical protein